MNLRKISSRLNLLRLIDLHYLSDKTAFLINNTTNLPSLLVFLHLAFFIFTQIFFTIGFVLLLIAVIGVLAIQLCFVIKKEIYAMKVLAIDLSVSGAFQAGPPPVC